MDCTKGFEEHEVPSHNNLLPGKRSISVTLGCGIPFTLDTPYFGDDAPSLQDTRNILPKHIDFRRRIYSEEADDSGFSKRCTAEVDAISTFFPHLQSESLHVSFAAWLSFACAMDDILETMQPMEREKTLAECIALVEPSLTACPKASWCTNALGWLRRSRKGPETTGDARVPALTRHLLDHCRTHLSEANARVFFKAVVAVFRAHIEEARFMRGAVPADIPTYMRFRSQTISLNPFFEVIKSEYLTPEWRALAAWDKLQHEVSSAAGLQNDLIGLERDMDQGEPLNAIVVLLRASGVQVSAAMTDKTLLANLVQFVAEKHNQSVALALDSVADIFLAAGNAPRENFRGIASVVRHIVSLADTHLKWCSAAKRYQAKVVPDLSSARPLPSSNLDSKCQIVRSVGIFHGLPVYPKHEGDEGMTAIVAGATGLSGYHMVRVLVASRRWKRILCLGSRSPPADFFAGLGGGADRVEHAVVDFQADPSEIARRVAERVSSVDCVFYFSYMQPAPKGNVLDLWANADELATVNAAMFNNFIAGLKLTQLKPKRFLLQTGTKHYGFYLGPACLPAFESDPRVTLDRNFYYEQEDAMHAYCQSVGATWGVARPSYIIGAVPDGSLNHLVGFGIYAAVQAHLNQPIRFPGDYGAWDREQVQSTALLNAYFEEWMVLNENAANQAFNIHDGQCFTWGRLWPMLARWYNAAWVPPESDESKYRVMTLPNPSTPRGHGPQAIFRSTSSLLEWSLQPKVEVAWKELTKAHKLVLDPFSDQYRARIFSFSDSAVIGNAPMTSSVRKARHFGFHGTVDSYQSIFDTFHELARLKLIPKPAVEEFDCSC
ncbi:hypothetical protein B0T16DRAFT_389965 [Cercophora newfieldiana]|uniref:PRISE-like Rossmann-fold domain-containing protein n=1 Tax=Cercophora newfieldiana TaxID=92897 RepID=A0AA39YCA9_9PEZI|nr:hypothetical protein B0T16DRAFT_389965 [Cercophora newfieldiana]